MPAETVGLQTVQFHTHTQRQTERETEIEIGDDRKREEREREEKKCMGRGYYFQVPMPPPWKMPRRDKKKKKAIGWNARHGEGLKEKSIIKGPDRRQRTGLDFHKGMKRSTTPLNTESYGSLQELSQPSC